MPYETRLSVDARTAVERPARTAFRFDVRGAARAPHRALDHVHRRRADELRDEEIAGPVVEIERRADLLDAPVVHDDDAVRHRHRLHLVVRHVDSGGLEPLVQRLDLGAHRDAQLRVEVRQRLVEQEHLRVAHDRAAHGDALPLAAGQLAGIAVQIRIEVEDLRGLVDTRSAIIFGSAFRSFRLNAMLSATVMCG